MPSLIIRNPHAHEAEVLADLHLTAWEETYSGQFPPSEWGEEARRARIQMWTAICTAPRPGDRFAVAERGGKVVGIAASGISREDSAPVEPELWLIYLLASEQGSGAGQSLLDAVVGSDAASLWVLEDNPRARAFYSRNGFRFDGTRKFSGFDTAGDEIRLVR